MKPIIYFKGGKWHILFHDKKYTCNTLKEAYKIASYVGYYKGGVSYDLVKKTRRHFD